MLRNIFIFVLEGDEKPSQEKVLAFLNEELPPEKTIGLNNANIRMCNVRDYEHALRELDNHNIPLATVFTSMPADASFPIFVLRA